MTIDTLVIKYVEAYRSDDGVTKNELDQYVRDNGLDLRTIYGMAEKAIEKL